MGSQLIPLDNWITNSNTYIRPDFTKARPDLKISLFAVGLPIVILRRGGYAYNILYFRESKTNSVYNKIRIKSEKYKSGFTANAKKWEKKCFCHNCNKKIWVGPNFGGSVGQQTYFYFWPNKKAEIGKAEELNIL